MKDSRVLVVETESSGSGLVSEALSLTGLDSTKVRTPAQACELLEFESFDLLISELEAKDVRGDRLYSRALRIDSDLAVVLVTSHQDVHVAVRCLREGASDYILKPIDHQDVAVRAWKALEHRRLKIADREKQRELERLVKEQSDRILSMLQSSLQTLTHALEAKDRYTRNHSDRVAELAVSIAKKLYPLDFDFHEKVRFAALLHDIGKIGISESALNHPGALTPAMFAEVKKHPVIGENILAPLIQDREILEIVRHHHERMDGTGYPDGLKGGDIPLGARIVAVADAYDAMVSERPYRHNMSGAEALSILRNGAGIQWDTVVVEATLQLMNPVELAA
jgi:putative two-component system response regulator